MLKIDNPRLRHWRTRLLIFLVVVGPGLITANVDNDAGGIYTYSVAGARFGYSLLWTLIPITVALIVVQDMAARMGIVTGKGLADLIREEYGFRTTFVLMTFLVIGNFGETIANFAGLASGMGVFGASRFLVVPLGALIVWGFVIRGSYKSVERIFLVGCLFYVAYPISAFLANPDWGSAMKATVVPTFRWDSGYLYMLIGVIGTTITPWMQFYLQASVVEKGTKVRNWVHARWDVIVGCLLTDIVAFFIMVACAATIFVSGHQDIRHAGDAALALAPVAGNAAKALFAFGICNASLLAASIIPLTTAYYVCEGLGLESGIDRRFEEAPTFYWLYSTLIFLSALVVVVLREQLQIPIIVLSQVANGILLPFILIFMLRLSNRPDLMGAHRNSRGFNLVAWVTAVVMIGLTFLLMVSALFPSRLPA
jgi:Mn2+/Fe2+ NRAMP family transporter